MVEDTRRKLRRAGLWVVGFFWLIQFLELTAVAYTEGGTKTFELLMPRAIIVVVGVLLSLVIIEVVTRSAGLPFRTRLLRTVAAAFLTCMILVPVNFGIFYITFRSGWIRYDLITFLYTAFTWSWFFFTVAGALLALTYSYDVRERERQLVSAEAEARDARMAALRYQLNPHFLFNTLNAIAALIESGENGPAERMVENLSDFLRVTLELDPVSDIPLGQEVQLQSLYLSIEEIRFPQRLITSYVIPRELRGALVPALITQPLVENAVRHSVARSARPVTVTISAAVEAGMLRIIVEDDGQPRAGRASGGMGVGLKNIHDRLRGRFGDQQRMDCGPRLAGGFAATMQLPLRYAQ
jgi:two-component system LytT family sensor kinase